MTRALPRRRIAEHPNREAWDTTTALHVALELSRRDQRAHRLRADPPMATVADDDHVATADQVPRALTKT